MKNKTFYVRTLWLLLLSTVSVGWLAQERQAPAAVNAIEMPMMVTASQSFENEQKSFQVITNDINTVKDSILIFRIGYTKQLDKKTPENLTEKLVFKNSNPDVVSIRRTVDKTHGDTVSLAIKNFGRSIISVYSPKNNELISTVQAYVGNYDYIKYDSLYSIQIVSEGSKNSIDPMDLKSSEYLFARHRFFAKAQYKATDFARYDWELSPDTASSFLVSNTGDTIDAYFKSPGEHRIFIKQKSTGEKLDSMSFYVNLHDSVQIDPQTGALNKIIDNRDGQLYKILMVPLENDTFFVMNEPLRSVPYINPMVAYQSGTNVKLIVKADPVFTFNVTQAYDSIHMPTLFNDIAAIKVEKSSDIVSKLEPNKASYCPKGWFVPDATNLATMFANGRPDANGVYATNATFIADYKLPDKPSAVDLEIGKSLTPAEIPAHIDNSISTVQDVMMTRGINDMNAVIFYDDKKKMRITTTISSKWAYPIRCIYKKK